MDRSNPSAPERRAAGLAALGLPERVSSPEEALRAAIRHLLPWRRPALRMPPRGLCVSIDDPDDARAWDFRSTRSTAGIGD